MFSGTEPLTDRSSTQGTELCAIAERILASTVAIKILGDASIGDQLERIAYNALPAALSPDIKGLRYYSLPNQPKCTNEELGFCNNGNGQHAICASPHSGFGCCRSNFHFAWPKFVQSMWMATKDGGLAVAAYGPNCVTARVGREGSVVTIDQETDYPFQVDSTLTIKTARPVAFPLELRIPGWCSHPTVQVNGEGLKDITPGSFHRIERQWNSGDRVRISFPMTLMVSHWIHQSVAITRGPLIFSLLIAETRKSTQAFLNDQFHTYESRPASEWNYALLLKDRDSIEAKTTVAQSMPAQPFSAADAPVQLKLKAFKTSKADWGTYCKDHSARAMEPPVSPVGAVGEVEDIVLVPYGSTEIRITLFPWATL
jgi:DUF1680 family protein